MSCGRTNCRCTGNGRPQLQQLQQYRFSEFDYKNRNLDNWRRTAINYYWDLLSTQQRSDVQRRLNDGTSLKLIFGAIFEYLKDKNPEWYVSPTVKNYQQYKDLLPYVKVFTESELKEWMFYISGANGWGQYMANTWNKWKDKAVHQIQPIKTPEPTYDEPNFGTRQRFQGKHFQAGVKKVWPYTPLWIKKIVQKQLTGGEEIARESIVQNLIQPETVQNRNFTDFYWGYGSTPENDKWKTFFGKHWKDMSVGDRRSLAIASINMDIGQRDSVKKLYNKLSEKLEPESKVKVAKGASPGAKLQIIAAAPFMDTSTLNYVNGTHANNQLRAALATLVRAERPDLIRTSWGGKSTIMKMLKWYQAEVVNLLLNRYNAAENPAQVELFNKYGRFMNGNSYTKIPVKDRTTLAGIYPYSRPLKTQPTEYDYKVGPTGNRIWPQSNAKPYTYFPPPLGINKGNSGYPSGPMPDPVAPVTPEPSKPEPAKPKPEPVTPPVVTPEPTPEPTPVVGPKLPSCAEVERVYKAEKDKWWIKWSELVTLGGEKHYNFFLGILAEFTNILNATFDHSHVKCTRNTVTF